MNIVIDLKTYSKLEDFVSMSRNMECSGYGFCRRDGDDILIYDAMLLDIGDAAYTEIKVGKVGHLVARAMMRDDARFMKVWWHRHPIGDGNPGGHNWSARDEKTCREEPFGLPAPDKGFSVSIVRTPHGWAGRIDTYGPEGKATHLPVVVPGKDMSRNEFNMISDLIEWEPIVYSNPGYIYSNSISGAWNEWQDYEINGEMPFRESYADDDDYLADLAMYHDADTEEFIIDKNGNVFLDNRVVGYGVRKKEKKSLFSFLNRGSR